jgi:hypothetical protein
LERTATSTDNMNTFVMMVSFVITLLLLQLSILTQSFVLYTPTNLPHTIFSRPTTFLHISSTGVSSRSASSSSNTFQLVIDVPPSNSDVQVSMNIESILSIPSELIIVRYKVPFGLNIEPRKNFAIVTANGPGGEQVGDLLRYTSHWTMGLPRGDGIGTTFASFAGGLKWQCSMFNVMSVKQWEQVIQALVSNTIDRTDEVVLIFERPLNGVIPPELQ